MVQFDGPYTTINHDSYTEYQVSANGHLQITIEDNDTFENVHINQEASGASSRILTYYTGNNLNDNWLIRNVAVTGTRDDGSYQFTPACNTTGRVEHCYFGDGDWHYPGSPHGTNGFAWAPREHSGHIEIHGCYINGWTDNGFYLSAPGEMTGSGSFELSNCYASNCHIALYRLGGGTSPGQDRVRNCYGFTSSNDHRGVWVYDNAERVEVIDCELEASGSTAIIASGTVYLENTSYTNSATSGGRFIDGGGNDNNPTEFIPRGCPMTAEEAYTGEAAGDDDEEERDRDTLDPVDPDPYDATIVFRNEEGGTREDGEYPIFYHQAGGEIEETEDYDTEISSNVWQEEVDDWHASGRCQWREAFRYNYPTVGLMAEDPITVEINGQVVDPDDYGTPNYSTPPSDDDPDMSRLQEETFSHGNMELYDGDVDHFTIDYTE